MYAHLLELALGFLAFNFCLPATVLLTSEAIIEKLEGPFPDLANVLQNLLPWDDVKPTFLDVAAAEAVYRMAVMGDALCADVANLTVVTTSLEYYRCKLPVYI